ncbi:MAG: tetratricopeptide repeat protein [Bdellovibrionaceae bacterium]|mgnify:FL=1|jgi:type IV pilus assembly protein PilF|nr:tetratricopeptide repeat protein [Pseudobdellovibrionaceae bacterium]
MRKNLISSILILITIFLSSCSSKQKQNKLQAKHYLSLGTSYLSRGEYPQALSALLKAVELNPDSAEAENHLGLAFYVREKYQDAEKHILKAIKLKPVYTDARNNLGRVYIQTEKYDLAIKQLKIAIEDLEYPYPEKSLSNLGLAYLKSKDYETAKKYLKKSLKIRRLNCHTYNYFARSLYETAKYHKANQAYKTTIMLCTRQNFPNPIYYSALSHLKVGHREQAIAKLNEVRELYPNTPFASEAEKMLEIINKEMSQ